MHCRMGACQGAGVVVLCLIDWWMAARIDDINKRATCLKLTPTLSSCVAVLRVRVETHTDSEQLLCCTASQSRWTLQLCT